MKKSLAGLGVLALVAIGATGASFPANASSLQPVAEIVASSDAIVASPDAVLSQSEPVVTTSPAEIVAEPVAVAPEPVVTPAEYAEPVVAPVAPVVAPEPVAVVADAPVAAEPVADAVVAPEPAGKPVYAEDGSLISNPDFYYSQEQMDAMVLAARTRDEGTSWFPVGYISAQGANFEHREGYVYTPSLVDPTKVHVSVIPFDQVPVAGSTATTVPADKSLLEQGGAWAGSGTFYATQTTEPVAAK